MSEKGWFAYGPEGAEPRREQAVTRVWLEPDEYAGPFRCEHGILSGGFAELHRGLGLSGDLFDDVMAWNEAEESTEPRAHFAQQQELLRRLGDEVHEDIEVPAPRAEPPVPVELGRLNVAGDELVLWDAAAVESGLPTRLPPVLRDLADRVVAWMAEAWRYDESTGDNDAASWAWQDEGDLIARELQAALGDDYRVVAC